MSLGREEAKDAREDSWKNKSPTALHFLGSYFSFSIKYYNHLKYFILQNHKIFFLSIFRFL